jgi:hypothetical protein
MRHLQDAGAAALVMFSLFEEQIRQENEALEHLSGLGTDSFAEALSYSPAAAEYEVGPEAYSLSLLMRSLRRLAGGQCLQIGATVSPRNVGSRGRSGQRVRS